MRDHQDPAMCDYTGNEFGAPYPDSICINGTLWDTDSADGSGQLQTGGTLPCPKCNRGTWMAANEEAAFEGGALAFAEALAECAIGLDRNPDPPKILYVSNPGTAAPTRDESLVIQAKFIDGWNAALEEARSGGVGDFPDFVEEDEC